MSAGTSLIQLQDADDEEKMLNRHGRHFYDDDDGDLGFRHEQFPKYKKTAVTIQKKSLIFWSVVVVISAITVGFFTGKLMNKEKKQRNNWVYDDDIRDAVWNEINPENIRNNLRLLTSQPHLAGSKRDEEDLVNLITDRWLKDLDETIAFPYDVLLSFPNKTDASYVGISHENGTVTNQSHSREPPVNADEDNPNVVPAINAYSPSGHVEGKLFYVNFGRHEDFKQIEHLNLSGGICIARYGRIFRGDKVSIASKNNCSGLLLFSDPLEYSGAQIHSWSPNSNINTYPHSWWLPPSGFQRGSLFMKSGDPLTPDYPSINFTHRIPESEAGLPTIPVLPISFADAYQYLSMLDGDKAPQTWQGGLNITYKIGGSFRAPWKQSKCVLHVNNYNKRKTIHSVIGIIRGWLEPDRYVLLGNHRDAWTFGGLDPSSGTAVVMEVSRAIATIVHHQGWRPRRTIVFCNWGAEEYGLLGSSEWVQQFEERLLMQAVAYVNIDIAVQGNATFRASSTPDLYRLMYDITKKVPNPNPQEVEAGRSTVYDTWLKVSYDRDKPDQPYIRNLGSGSDYATFLQSAGVSCVDFRYTYSQTNISSYPVYHSIHDTFEYFSTFVDPEFHYSRAVAGIAADSMLQLSGSVVLPLRPTSLASKLSEMARRLERVHGNVLSKHGIALDELNRIINHFNNSVMKMMTQAEKLNEHSSDIEVRKVNDKIFLLNRAFIDRNGIPGRHDLQNVIFAPSLHDSYSSSGFPAVYNAIFEAEALLQSWENVKSQLSVVEYHILMAAHLAVDF